MKAALKTRRYKVQTTVEDCGSIVANQDEVTREVTNLLCSRDSWLKIVSDSIKVVAAAPAQDRESGRLSSAGLLPLKKR
jgi:hypothetical protein